MDEDSPGFRLSLRFRTFQKQGLLMATNASDWGTLQVGLHAEDPGPPVVEVRASQPQRIGPVTSYTFATPFLFLNFLVHAS